MLVAVPVAVFCWLAFSTLLGIVVAGGLAAFGHGTLDDSEELQLRVLGGIITIAGSIGTALVLERVVFGPARSRSQQARALSWQTRAASAVLMAVIYFGAAPAWSWWHQRNELANAFAKDHVRFGAISRLGARETPEARAALMTIARDRSEPEDVRVQAIAALSFHSDGRDVLLSLSSDPAPGVRAAVGLALLRFAGDSDAWATVQRLARDQSAMVRERVAALLAVAQLPAGADERRRELMREIAKESSPDAALDATAMLGAEGYDIALAILMDVSQPDATRQKAIQVLGKLEDRRAIGILQRIVNGQTAEGFIKGDPDEGYRGAAAQALTAIAGRDGDELALAYANEGATRHELQRVAQAQAKYAAATGFFDSRLACLELPATCAPGRDVDESFLGPALASDLPRHGYQRRLIGGPAPAAAEIAARRASPTSVKAFAYIAYPQKPFESGIRGFCTDDTGAVCVSPDGRAPVVRNGRCVCQAR